MPVYEFECWGCGLFDKFYHIKVRPPYIKCCKCGRMMMRIISLPGAPHMNGFKPGYIGGVARYPGDPEGWCKSLNEVYSKLGKRGIPPEAVVVKGKEDAAPV